MVEINIKLTGEYIDKMSGVLAVLKGEEIPQKNGPSKTPKNEPSEPEPEPEEKPKTKRPRRTKAQIAADKAKKAAAEKATEKGDGDSELTMDTLQAKMMKAVSGNRENRAAVKQWFVDNDVEGGRLSNLEEDLFEDFDFFLDSL